MAMQRLTFGGAFAARLGVCSRCHHRRTVVKAA
jgi:cytochrome c553